MSGGNEEKKKRKRKRNFRFLLLLPETPGQSAKLLTVLLTEEHLSKN
jgi:hypothetical protein